MTKRRAKGDGSVYQLKDGRCVGEYDHANAKKRYVSGKTKAEVKAHSCASSRKTATRT